MILGDTCTRSCGYCNVTHGTPKPPDAARAGQGRAAPSTPWRLDYVVITSVDRDDLPDCGAAHFARTIARDARAHAAVPHRSADPRFQGRRSGAAHRARRAARRAQPQHRDRAAAVSHGPARAAATTARCSCSIARGPTRRTIPTKSGLMVGLGEEWDEVVATLRRSARGRLPDRHHRPVSAAVARQPADGALLHAGRVRRAQADRPRAGLRPRRVRAARPQLVSRARADPGATKRREARGQRSRRCRLRTRTLPIAQLATGVDP